MARKTNRKSAVKKKAADNSPRVAKRTTASRVAKRAATPPKTAASSDRVTASGRIDRMIANLGDWRGERLAEIRALIHEIDPGVVEEWKWMGSPVWSHDGMYVLANAHKGKVKLTFFHGARLPDPGRLFNAGTGGNTWRAIDLREGDTIDKPALAALLRAAIAYNTTHAVPKSRGSRSDIP